MHPLLLPTGCFFIFLYITPLHIWQVSPVATPWLLLMIFVMTFLIPITAISLYYWNGTIEDLEMKTRASRVVPFGITTVLYAITTTIMFFGNAYQVLPVLPIMLGSITLTLAVVTWITAFWKISAHSTGICGVLGWMLGIAYKYGEMSLLYPIAITVILAGALMTARLYLQAHNPFQILAGAWLGLVINFLAILIFL
jgi:membrane-associated phospholipid phosphatase